MFVDYPKNAAQSGPLKPISPLCSLGKYKQKEKKGVLRVTSTLELGFKSHPARMRTYFSYTFSHR